jgi:hypothetical protein
MRRRHAKLPLVGSVAALILVMSLGAPGVVGAAALGEQEAFDLGVEAYIYGYPLVTMEMLRRVMTNVSAPEGKLAPMGQFAKVRTFPSPSDRTVGAPNADILYSLAWLDLSRGPWILGIPDTKGRYFLMPMLDGWTNVFQVPGKRTTGTKPHKYAITGPGWKGTLPKGVTELMSPTNMVWILGQIHCTGTSEDYRAVHALQDQFSLVPVNASGRTYTPRAGVVDPTVDMATPVWEQVHRMDVWSYFRLLAALMQDNPPAAADAPMVAKMAKLGIVPGQDFDVGKLDVAVAKALLDVPQVAQEKIAAHAKNVGKPVNGWTTSLNVGVYGIDYLQRAFVAETGLGASRPQDAIFLTSEVDGDGRPYDGAQKYTIRFLKGQGPPASGFWSLTMYDAESFFVPNPLNRYALGSHSTFKRGKDGSLTFYIQKDSPGRDREPNWLPAPAGKFILMLRLYWPRKSMLEGAWQIPPVKRVDY